MRCPTTAGSTVGEKSSPLLMINHVGATWGYCCRHGLWYLEITDVHLKTSYNFTNFVYQKIIFPQNIKLITGKECAIFYFFFLNPASKHHISQSISIKEFRSWKWWSSTKPQHPLSLMPCIQTHSDGLYFPIP